MSICFHTVFLSARTFPLMLLQTCLLCHSVEMQAALIAAVDLISQAFALPCCGRSPCVYYPFKEVSALLRCYRRMDGSLGFVRVKQLFDIDYLQYSKINSAVNRRA